MKKSYIFFTLILYLILNYSNLSLADLSALEDFGSITTNIKETRGYIVIIKDYPQNLFVQKNIFNIIDIFIKNYNINFIAVEGFNGSIDTTPLASFPNTEIKKDVSFQLLTKGLISAAEYYSINNDQLFMLYGLEQDNYYEDFLEIKKEANSNKYQSFLSQRAEFLLENFLTLIQSFDTEKSILILSHETLPLAKQKFDEKNISYIIVDPKKDPAINLFNEKTFFENDPKISLPLGQPIRVSFFEYNPTRINFMNEYISKLLFLSLIKNQDIPKLIEKWKENIKSLIEKKQAFFTSSFVEKENNIPQTKLFSTFNILNTQEKEFNEILPDIQIYPLIKLYNKGIPIPDEFLSAVSFIKLKKTLLYYWFKDTPSFFKRYQKNIYKLGAFNYSLLTPDEFLKTLIKRPENFFSEESALKKLAQLNDWSFLNLFQKEYLLLTGTISLSEVFSEIDLIITTMKDYEDTTKFNLEKEIVSGISNISNLFFPLEEEKLMLKEELHPIFDRLKKAMLETLLSYVAVFRILNSNRGDFDLIAGDILYKYEGTLKTALYGKNQLDELIKLISPQAQILSEQILIENNYFGIIENLSQWLFKKLESKEKINFGKVQEGILQAEDIEYDLNPTGIENNEEHFLNRLKSNANALKMTIPELLSHFNFSRLRIDEIKTKEQLIFIFASAYLQNKIKKSNQENNSLLPYLKENLALFDYLVIDLSIIENTFIDPNFITFLLKNRKKMFIFSTGKQQKELIDQKLIFAGFIKNDLENEISETVKPLNVSQVIPTGIALIEDSEDLIERIITNVASQKHIPFKEAQNKIFLLISKENLITNTLNNKLTLLIPNRYLIVEKNALLLEAITVASLETEKELTLFLKNLYNTLDYSTYEIDHLINNIIQNKTLPAEPRNKFLIELLLKIKKLADNNVEK